MEYLLQKEMILREEDEFDLPDGLSEIHLEDLNYNWFDMTLYEKERGFTNDIQKNQKTDFWPRDITRIGGEFSQHDRDTILNRDLKALWMKTFDHFKEVMEDPLKLKRLSSHCEESMRKRKRIAHNHIDAENRNTLKETRDITVAELPSHITISCIRTIEERTIRDNSEMSTYTLKKDEKGRIYLFWNHAPRCYFLSNRTGPPQEGSEEEEQPFMNQPHRDTRRFQVIDRSGRGYSERCQDCKKTKWFSFEEKIDMNRYLNRISQSFIGEVQYEEDCIYVVKSPIGTVSET